MNPSQNNVGIRKNTLVVIGQYPNPSAQLKVHSLLADKEQTVQEIQQDSQRIRTIEDFTNFVKFSAIEQRSVIVLEDGIGMKRSEMDVYASNNRDLSFGHLTLNAQGKPVIRWYNHAGDKKGATYVDLCSTEEIEAFKAGRVLQTA